MPSRPGLACGAPALRVGSVPWAHLRGQAGRQTLRPRWPEGTQKTWGSRSRPVRQAVLEALPRSGGARSAGPRLPLSVNLVKCKSHTAVFFTGEKKKVSCLLVCPYSGPELLFPPGLADLVGTGARSQVAEERRWVGARALNLVCLSPKPGQRRFPRASCLPS